MESFRFQVRKQYTSHLCRRPAPVPPAPGTPGSSPRGLPAGGRYGGRSGSASVSPRAAGGEGGHATLLQQQAKAQQGQGGKEVSSSPGPLPPQAAASPGEQRPSRPTQRPQQQQNPAGRMADAGQAATEFGFPHLVSCGHAYLNLIAAAGEQPGM